MVTKISYYIGYIGVIVICWGVFLNSLRLINYEIKKIQGREKFNKIELLRYHLGLYLLFGLEIMIAADIIGTIANPTFDELGKLAAVVFIRTVINFFLDREMEERVFSGIKRGKK